MKRSILLLIGFFWLITTQAQTQSQTKSQNQSQSQSQQQQPPVQLSDISKVRVDQLSDEQITKIMTDAEKRGLTDDQLLQGLAQRGMPAAEQQKLRSRMAALRQKGSPVGKRAAAMPTPMDQQGRQVVDTTTAFVDSLMIVEEEADTSRIFGAKLFRNTNIQFQPNLNIPTPKNYVIGTGDELLLDLTGDNEASYTLPVTPEGTININYVGIVPVSGLTIEDAADKIRNRMQPTYPQLGSGRTRLSLTLGNIRSIKVTLTGYVTRPGTYTLPSLANVFHALYASGGPSDKGTYRGIQLIRNNRVIETIDTYDFLTKGIQPGNVRLEDGDVIHIPVFNRHVTVDGLVNNPGIFEPVESETLEDVLRFAGDFSPEAYRAKVKVLQVTDRQRSVADIYAEDFSRYTPRNGDHYIVEEVLDRYANRVAIEGAVFRPGLYALTDGLTLRELIRRADGLKEDAFMSRAYINRLNPDNTQQLITVDLAQLMAGSTQQDHVLQREDKVIISSIFDLREEYTVSISGQVRKPGEFEYVEQMTLGNLIQMSGGLAEAANIEYIDVARRIRRNTNERDSTISELVRVSFDSREEAVQSDFVLQPFDMVSVHTSTGYQVQRLVRIEGEVMYPGEYVLLKKDEKVSDLIRRAGGVTEFAYLPGASLQRKASDAMLAQGHSALTSLDQQELRELELEQSALQSIALENTAEGGTKTELFFSNYVGIQLDRILEGDRKYDIPLEDEDVIIVPRQLRTVTVRGQVLNPNRIVYQKGKPLKYYIRQAGGFTAKAHKKKTFVQHANGSVEGSRWGYPEVLPGSEIIVPTRPEREKIPVQAWVSMGSVITSMAAVIVSLLR
ncbi:SLBB domain-containing protein [Parapedobacter sp. ISTM3]|uniref:SLBB domain-containing protein n=1 Tax=Parapedobacter sp. ISTM3 TaxID=2800130 RepID=UPI001905522A|nr:SLBB domain-containing protein [Parapedobacter sp. ISTM3]MBK1438374.1 SLBB domain-containing protein [Parapedobacter sp. ISTM3]